MNLQKNLKLSKKLEVVKECGKAVLFFGLVVALSEAKDKIHSNSEGVLRNSTEYVFTIILPNLIRKLKNLKKYFVNLSPHLFLLASKRGDSEKLLFVYFLIFDKI
ncbi:hypothetical protein J7K44_02320 [bacterium]|nr:hypothetical protein [bacterium]